MKVFINKFPIDENSNEEKEIIIGDIYIGKLNVGLYSRWYINHLKNNKPAPADIYIKRFIYETYGYPMRNKEEILYAKEEIEHKYNKTITELFKEQVICK